METNLKIVFTGRVHKANSTCKKETFLQSDSLQETDEYPRFQLHSIYGELEEGKQYKITIEEV